MNPGKVDRATVKLLTDLPNIGRAMAADLRIMGITSPEQLIGKDPFELHQQLCRVTGMNQDPCVIDVFMSITSFMNGEPPRPWWHFTATRKAILGKKTETIGGP